jgi:hypothetical protein
MKKVGALLLELRELEAEIPVPPLREYEAMKARGECTFETFFLGLVGMIDFELDEAVHGLWGTYGQVSPGALDGENPALMLARRAAGGICRPAT